MSSYSIPIRFEPFERQKKAARLVHFLAAFLMLANAWGDFNQPTPNLLFTVIQVAGSLITVVYAFAGEKLLGSSRNGLFRLIEALIFLFAAWYFYSKMNLHLMGLLQLLAAVGLILLLITERTIFAPTTITIDEKGITTPNNFKNRFIPWASIDTTLIKNDFVSINTIHNHFIQYEPNIILSELQMDELNAFCREQFLKN